MSRRLRIPEWVFDALLQRASGLCEARTPACLAGPDGRLERLDRGRVSIQHRLARGMGGTRREDQHDLANLMIFCGHGTIGCHFWVEDRRPGMEERGLWMRHGVQDPTEVPVVLASGRVVLLGTWYTDVGWWAGPVPGSPEWVDAQAA